GGAQAITDLVAGHVKIGVVALTTTAPHIRAGTLTLTTLAVSSSRRLPQYPELPTLKELGYHELVTTTWWSFSGPARRPPEVVTRLNRELNALFDSGHSATQARAGRDRARADGAGRAHAL